MGADYRVAQAPPRRNEISARGRAAHARRGLDRARTSTASPPWPEIDRTDVVQATLIASFIP
jgi:hypothetical protein